MTWNLERSATKQFMVYLQEIYMKKEDRFGRYEETCNYNSFPVNEL
jgi:hypothetical protein